MKNPLIYLISGSMLLFGVTSCSTASISSTDAPSVYTPTPSREPTKRRVPKKAAPVDSRPAKKIPNIPEPVEKPIPIAKPKIGEPYKTPIKPSDKKPRTTVKKPIPIRTPSVSNNVRTPIKAKPSTSTATNKKPRKPAQKPISKPGVKDTTTPTVKFPQKKKPNTRQVKN